jgi:hypothetical protein
MHEAPSSPAARAAPSERWIARALEGVSTGQAARRTLARLEDRRVCLYVVAPRGASEAWLPYSAAAERRGGVAGERLLPLVASGRLEGTFFVAYEIGRMAPLSTDGAVAELTTSQALQLLWGIGRALDHAVASGRHPVEVTPDSVFVDRSRGAFLADLGVAREALGNPPAAEDAHAPWVAPEILSRGEPVERTAVYSFGALMYTLLTGAPPHEGTPEEIAAADPPSLSEARPDLPEALALVVATAMARDPRRRYRTTSEARSLAQVVLQGELQPVSPPARHARFRRALSRVEPAGPDRLAALEQEAEVERRQRRAQKRSDGEEGAAGPRADDAAAPPGERAAGRERGAQVAERASAVLQALRQRRAAILAALEGREAQVRERRAATFQALREQRAARREREREVQLRGADRDRRRDVAAGERGRREAPTLGALRARRIATVEALRRKRDAVRDVARERRTAGVDTIRERRAQPTAQRTPSRPPKARTPRARASPPAGATLGAARRSAVANSLPLALVGGALALGVLGGALLGGAGDDEAAAPQGLSGGGLALRLPADWEGTASGPGALEAHPAGDARSGLALELVDEPVRPEEQGNPVRLGRLEAWREGAEIPGSRAAVRYVVPTETGKLVATCTASPRAASGTLALCERTASTLRLRSATGLPLVAVVDQQERWQAAVNRLAGERRRARRSLARASRPAGQRLAAEALARVNERGAERFAALPGGEAVAAAARRTAAAYTALARSAGAPRVRRWNAASERVRRAEAALRSAVASS